MSKRYGFGNYQYEVVPGWAKGPRMGIVSAVACDSRGRVYLAVRSTPYPQVLSGAVLVFDRDGKLLRSWGEDLVTTPHGIWVSPDDEVFLADASDHTVRKFSSSGKLLMTLGTKGQPGGPGAPFNRPTRAVVSSTGDIFVSDGYGQNLVHRFTSRGELMFSWGSTGSGPGEFNLPHGVTLDDDDRAYISDRENRRCQVFSSNGEYLCQWGDLLRPEDLFIDADGVVHIAEVEQRISVMTKEGEVIGRWGEKGTDPGQFSHFPHSLWIDSRGDLYVSEVGAPERLQKFARA